MMLRILLNDAIDKALEDYVTKLMAVRIMSASNSEARSAFENGLRVAIAEHRDAKIFVSTIEDDKTDPAK